MYVYNKSEAEEVKEERRGEDTRERKKRWGFIEWRGGGFV
jgi:hypothetical protein